MDFNFDTTLEIRVHIRVQGFTPASPPTICGDPDSPLYSNPGDGSEYENFDIYLRLPKVKRFDGKLVVVDDYYKLTDNVANAICESLEYGLYDEISDEGAHKFREMLDDKIIEREEERL